MLKEIRNSMYFLKQLPLWQKNGAVLILCFFPLLCCIFLYLPQKKDSFIQKKKNFSSPKNFILKAGFSQSLGKKEIFSPSNRTKNSSRSYQNWIFKDSFFENQWKNKLRSHVSLEKKLEEMIASIPSVQKAIVQIASSKVNLFSRKTFPSKAAITLYLNHNKNHLSFQTVQSITQIVASSVLSLEPENISILANGRMYSLKNYSSVDKRKFLKEYYQEKLKKSFASYSVSDFSLSISSSHKVDGANLLLMLPETKLEEKKRMKHFYKKLASHTLAPLPLDEIDFLWIPLKKEQPSFFSLALLDLKKVGVFLLCFVFLLIGFVIIQKKKSFPLEKPWNLEVDLPFPIYSFEELHLLPDSILKESLLEIDTEVLGLALKVSLPKIKQKILRNLHKNKHLVLEQEMDRLGPVRLSKVEDAQEEILSIIKRVGRKVA